MSESFTVMNGVKQGGVLSPVLFAVYTDGLLLRLQESGIGCHIGGHYAGALAYADDITLISPRMTGLRKMSSICEQYASEYDILFNGNKSELLFIKGRCCNVSTLGIVVCGQLVEMSATAVHLGHTIHLMTEIISLNQQNPALEKFHKNYSENMCITSTSVWHMG